MSSQIKLTEYSHGAGCGCKIAPSMLERILHGQIEFAADKKASEIIKDPKIVGEALIKIHSSNIKMEFGQISIFFPIRLVGH